MFIVCLSMCNQEEREDEHSKSKEKKMIGVYINGLKPTPRACESTVLYKSHATGYMCF